MSLGLAICSIGWASSAVSAATEAPSTSHSSAAGELPTLGSHGNAPHSPESTTGVAAAGQDEVSAAIAALFGNHAQEFQALSERAAAFHNQFVQTLSVW